VLIPAALILALACAILSGSAVIYGRALPDGPQVAYTTTVDPSRPSVMGALGLLRRANITLADVQRDLRVTLATYRRIVSPPVWSPDGMRLAYHVRGAFQGFVVHILRLDRPGSSLALPFDASFPSSLAFSPDGSRLALISDHQTPRAYVYVYDLTTRQVRQVSRRTALNRPLVWSADGAQIYFHHGDQGQESVWSVDVRTQAEAVLLPQVLESVALAWSPDRTRVIYIDDAPESLPAPNDELWLIDVASGSTANPVRLTQQPWPDLSPSWSPDGSQFVFTSERHGNFELYIAAPEPIARATRLTDHPARDLSPIWSPDGAWIAFYSDRDYPPGWYAMPAEGGPAQRFTARSQVTTITWRP
jgi:Tol biopolymer transport system component